MTHNPMHAKMPEEIPRKLRGTGVSPGLVIARVVVLKRQNWQAGWYQLPPGHIDGEVHRFKQAVVGAEAELHQLREKMAGDLTEALSIIDSHLLMLKDPMIVQRTESIIREHTVNAEWALGQALC